MNAADLRGRAIVTLSDAAKLGVVAEVLFDGTYHHVMGFTLQHGPFGTNEAVSRDRVSSVGKDALTVSGPDAVNALERLTDLSGTIGLSQVQQTKLVTESGTLLGTIDQVELDPEARTVVAYTLNTSLWEHLRNRVPRIEIQEVLRLGESGIMIVSDAAGTRLTAASE